MEFLTPGDDHTMTSSELNVPQKYLLGLGFERPYLLHILRENEEKSHFRAMPKKVTFWAQNHQNLEPNPC